MSAASPTLQSVLLRHFDVFKSGRTLPVDMLRASRRLMACRTAASGLHVRYCPNGHVMDIAYNCCRHRFCPQCSTAERQRWLERRLGRLLPCPHHHIVFTVPDELHALWRYNKRLFPSLMFRAANEALLELMADPKYCGGRPGVLAALHTWSQTLAAHVHLHVLVTAGALAPEGSWVNPQRDCLLPRTVLMLVFRGKLRHYLRQALVREDLAVPADHTVAQWLSKLNRHGRNVWNVKIHERYPHAKGVLGYLARYLRGGPLPNARILSDDHRGIRFRFRLPMRGSAAQQAKRYSTMTLQPAEFLRRLLEHVPPRGLQVVRGYGLYSGNQHSRLEEARASLPQEAPEDESVQREKTSSTQHWQHCPQCGERLVIQELDTVAAYRTLIRARAPPSDQPTRNPQPA